MNRGGHGGLRGKNSLTRLNQTSKFIQSRTHCHPRLTRNVKSLKPRLKWPEAWRSLSGTFHSPGVKHYGSADVRQGQLCGKRQPFPRWHRSQSLRRRDPPRATTDRSGRWTEAGQVLAGHAWTISRTGGGSYRFEVHRAQPGFPTGGPRHDGARDAQSPRPGPSSSSPPTSSASRLIPPGRRPAAHPPKSCERSSTASSLQACPPATSSCTTGTNMKLISAATRRSFRLACV